MPKCLNEFLSRVDENWLFTKTSDLQRKYDFILLIAQRVGINSLLLAHSIFGCFVF